MTMFTFNQNKQYAQATTINKLIYLNRKNGYHFFDDATMRSFRSRVHSEVYGGCVFVTSEKGGYNQPRMYTVRVMHDNGSIETCSSFGQYPTRYQAHEAAKHLIKHGFLTVI